MCIVRKEATDSSLGRRSVNGRHAAISDLSLQMAGQNLLSPDQGAELWTNFAFPTEEELTDCEAPSWERDARIAALREALAERGAILAEQKHRINTLETKVGALYASTSWRITAPLRGARRKQIWLSLMLSNCALSIVKRFKKFVQSRAAGRSVVVWSAESPTARLSRRHRRLVLSRQ